MVDLCRLLDTPLALRDTAAASLLERARALLHPTSIIAPPGLSPPGQVDLRHIPILFPGEDISTVDRPEQDATLVPPTPRSGQSMFDTVDNVAIVPVSGVLGSDDYWSDSTYGAIGASFAAAVADSMVRAIVLQIASPGGEVSGLFELAESVAAASGTKPVWAILDDHAYSAAYAIASAADFVTVPRTGGSGSIGVITLHLDVSKFLEDMGLKISIVQFGDRKSDYSLFKPLSEDARGRLQADVDTVGAMFVDLVARNRRMSKAKVRSTEAGIFMGSAGVEQGLVDAVMAPQEALADLIRRVS